MGLGLLSLAPGIASTILAETRSFEDYLATGPSTEIAVERNIAGHVNFFRLLWQNGSTVLSTGKATPPPDVLGSNMLASVVCRDGTNYWSLASAPNGVLLQYLADSAAHVREGDILLCSQILNLGLEVPFGSVRIKDGVWSYSPGGPKGKERFPTAMAWSHTAKVHHDNQRRLVGMENTIRGGTNSAVHRYKYDYSHAEGVPDWFPSKVVVDIQPHGCPEIRSAILWRVTSFRLLESDQSTNIFRPEQHIAPGTEVFKFIVKNEKTYKVTGNKLVDVEDLDHFSRTNRGARVRPLYWLLAAGLLVAPLLVVLVQRKKQRNQQDNHGKSRLSLLMVAPSEVSRSAGDPNLGVDRRSGTSRLCHRKSVSHSKLTRLILLGCLVLPGIATPQFGAVRAAVLVEGVLESAYIPSAAHAPTQNLTVRFRLQHDSRTGHWRYDDLSSPPRSVEWTRDDLVENTGLNSGEKASLIVSSMMDGYPIDLDWDTKLVWFVYCANGYVRSHQGQPVIIPDLDARSDLNVHGCRLAAHWETPDSVFPLRLEYVHDREVFERAIANLEMLPPGPRLDQRRQVYDFFVHSFTNGQVRGVFEVLGWTSIQGVSLPKQWRSIQRDPGATYRKTCTVEKLAELDSLTTATIPRVAHVTDKRLRSVAGQVNFVSYVITNGAIPDWNSVAMRKLVTMSRRPELVLMPPNLAGRRAFFVTVLVALFSFPFLVMWWRGTRRMPDRLQRASRSS